MYEISRSNGHHIVCWCSASCYQDIAVNGGFETGDFTGWTQFPVPGAGTQSITSKLLLVHMQVILLS